MANRFERIGEVQRVSLLLRNYAVIDAGARSFLRLARAPHSIKISIHHEWRERATVDVCRPVECR
jgi:hypothetical protein